ncbi:hypothetical protein ACWCSH_38700, partial [Streptosporangium sp. NPDC001682]
VWPLAVEVIGIRMVWLWPPRIFNRGSLICAVNCGSQPVRLPPHDRVLIGSAPVEGHLLLPDSAVWLYAPEV